MKKFHYVYRITNIVIKKYYYGSRSCDCRPKEDIGIKYFSSSKDKEFMKEQKEHPERFKYKVVKMFENRQNTLDFERSLHITFYVSRNEKFYNKIISGGRYFDNEGKISVLNKTGERITIPNNEYDRENHIFHTSGKVSAKDINGKTFMTLKNDERFKTGEISGVAKGMIVVINKTTNKCSRISKEIFKNSGNYLSYKHNKHNGNKNPNSNHINIFDSNNNIMFECHGNFKKTCNENNLPFRVLRISCSNNGKPIYQNINKIFKMTEKYERFKGWYAKSVNKI